MTAPAGAAPPQAPPGVARRVEACMGTVFSFDVRGGEATAGVGPDGWAPAIDQAVRWLRRVDEIFSTYRPDSQVSRLARGEVAVADCSPLVAEVLEIGARAVAAGAGAFTLTPRGRLDPAAVVKGWAIERASDILRAHGSRAHLVNGGGDIQTVGEVAPGEGWRVAIADPRRTGQVAAVVRGRDIAVATSGSAERGAHVVDPRTGQAPRALLSVTVVGRRLTDVDIAATTAYVLGPQGRAWLEEQPGLEGFGIGADSTMWSTSGFERYVVA